MNRILVVGGAGYVGSHTCKALARAGFQPIVFDNLSTGHRRAVKWGPLIVADMQDRLALGGTIATYRPDAIIHFAASAYVSESTRDPAKYYRNNVAGTLTVLEAALAAGIRRVVFSSSCAVYGAPSKMPINEETVPDPINPYGRSKWMVEQILADYRAAYDLSYVALRYFNAAGADPQGEVGEWHDPETHLVPNVLLAAAGRLPCFELHGEDYPTPDGTCIRDYIHVSDLAEAHVLALGLLDRGPVGRCLNLGTGRGVSIREVLAAAERVTARQIPVVGRPRRPGDPPTLVASPVVAERDLGFQARLSDIDTIIRTAWPFFAEAI
jgi:UDP-arabinose 4-epimerase